MISQKLNSVPPHYGEDTLSVSYCPEWSNPSCEPGRAPVVLIRNKLKYIMWPDRLIARGFGTIYCWVFVVFFMAY